ncbi:MAG TPA: hypothetical protein VG497_08420 [Kribbella sp.]|nr:hypothetical protein [Kribbella sp.]
MLTARSAQEAWLYMDLRVCDCGAKEFERAHRLEGRAGALVSVYEGTCGRCGRERAYEFRMTDELPPAPPAFGGDEPSEIIDPGEFLWVSDTVGEDAGLRLLNAPLAEQRQYRAAWEYSMAALQEVFKFLPATADKVPAERFTSERGQELYRTSPDRFERRWLIDGLARKRRVLAGIDAFSPPSG